MSTVYVNEPGAIVGLSDGRLTIRSPDGKTNEVPLETVDGLSVFGPVQITTQTVSEFLRRGENIQYYSSTGGYFGRLSSTEHVNVNRHKAQVYLSDNEDFRTEFSRNVILAKINNQLTLVRRYARSSKTSVEPEINAMRTTYRKISGINSVPELSGYEGTAARSYFSALGKLVDSDFAFDKRSRRPPLDPFNSMLSLGYSVLFSEVFGAIENRGLSPYFGFLHRDREGHPALVSDLMEEWRAVIVDSTVMSLVNGHEISPESFTKNTDGSVTLDRAGFKIFMIKLEKKFAVEMKYLDNSDHNVTFRRALNLQAGDLAKAVESGDPKLYSPVMIR